MGGFISSVQLLRVSDSLWPHGLQHPRPPCPSPTPGVYSTSCPLSWLCYPAISSSVIPFSSCLQSFPASGSFQMNHFFASDAQSIGVSASASVLPINIQDWFPLRFTGLISLLSKGHLLQNHSSKASILWQSAFFIVQLSHPYMTTLITHHILLINLSFYILYFTHSRVCRAYMSRVGWILTNDTCVTITQLRYIRIFFFTPWKIPFQSILTSYPHFSLKHIFRFWSV